MVKRQFKKHPTGHPQIRKGVYALVSVLVLLVLVYVYLAHRPVPQAITYGVSFNTLYAQELHVDWREAYVAVLDDLGVRYLRLAAHWDVVEPQDNQWDFSAIDYQVDMAEARGATIVLAVGRRLPRWPECHVPSWAIDQDWEAQKEQIREYMRVVVERYKGRQAITYWQVENEPFLEVFAHEHCGDLDVAFLDEQLALVRSLDSTRPVLVTDSGNLGTWAGPYARGDAFGTSVYVYLWNPDIGPFKSFLPPSAYRVKTSLMEILYGKRESMLIELSLEPWLLQPVVDTPLATQLERMNPEKFKEIIAFAKETRFEKQYLWGAEWWYYMKQRGYPELWEQAKQVYGTSL
ncbi:MAG: hypothetical protein RL150_209 [Candidatus Parcubacteria bacterium]|jgi:hypothetical protein